MLHSECSLEPNFNTLALYLSLLGGEKEIFTGFFLSPDGKKPIVGYGCVHGTASELIELSEQVWNTYQGSLHVCLNRTNLSGRKKKDIESTRVLVVDLDYKLETSQLTELVSLYQPNWWVESSPGKYHLYWRCEDYDLNLWRIHQGALAFGFEADPNLSDITKTLRAPGIPRLTKEGEWFTPTLNVGLDPWIVITPTTAGPKFSFLEDAIHEVRTKASTLSKQIRSALKSGDAGALASLSSAGTGRNSTVFRAVKMAASKPKGEEWDEAHAMDLALQLNMEFGDEVGGPLDDEELEKTARSGLTHGLELRESRRERIRAKMGEEVFEDATRVRAHVNGEIERNGEFRSSEVLNIEPQRAPYPYDYSVYDLRDRFNDTSVLERTLQQFSDSMIRVGDVIYAFDQKHLVWRKQRGKGQQEIIKGYVREAQRDTVIDPEFLESQCLTSEGEFSETKRNQAVGKFLSSRMNAAITGDVFGSEKVLRGTIDLFDANPTIIHVANGVLNLETLELEEASQEHLFLQQSGISWNPQADYSWWEEFLGQVFQSNDEPEKMVSFMQELFGYSLTGSVKAQKIFIHYGLNLNGKSKVLDALQLIMGSYARMTTGEAMANKANAIQKGLERIGATVEGKRIVVIDDMDTATQWNEGAAKTLTGERIAARRLYEEERTIPNRAKFHLGCNTTPTAEGLSAGILRRLCIIPYNHIFEQDSSKELEICENIKIFAEGILRWAAIGAQKVISNRFILEYPAETIEELEDYRAENFKVENVIQELFSVPEDGDESNDENWVAIDTLLKVLNEEIRNLKGDYFSMNARKLGKHLHEKMKFKCRRERFVSGKKRSREYFVQINRKRTSMNLEP